jgi:hypothetical protein
MCDCIENVDVELAKHNTKIVIPMWTASGHAIYHLMTLIRLMAPGVAQVPTQDADQTSITLQFMIEDSRKLQAEVEHLRMLIGRPYVGAWTDEILIEAAHQRDRWGNKHDHGKMPEDWFWLIGYLAGKALASHKAGDAAKAHHHTVSTAAVLAHWAAAIDGNEGIFRPGLGAEKVAASSMPSTDRGGK